MIEDEIQKQTNPELMALYLSNCFYCPHFVYTLDLESPLFDTDTGFALH